MVSGASSRRGARAVADDAPGPGDGADEGGSHLQWATMDELPWLADTLAQALARQQGHAVMVHADAGIGALEFAFALALGWLCEATDAAARPCGTCVSCRLARAQTHPDLMLRLPQSLALQHGVAVEHDDKRKPSRQIRVAEMRAALDWSVTTSGRGRGKVLLIHPAEAMNLVAASALLKTLEEPPAGMRIVLTTADPGLLLPTVMSRCQRVVLPRPGRDEAARWLDGRSVADSQVLLDATGGRPLTAWRWHTAGLDARRWAAIPAAVAAGETAVFADWPVRQVVEALQKLAHDAARRACGAEPRFFPAASVPAGADLAALGRWHQALQEVMRHADHPWSEALLVEALVGEGAQAWQRERPAAQPGRARERVDTLAPRPSAAR